MLMQAHNHNDTENVNVKSYINTFQWGINILCPDNKPPFNQEGYSCSIMTAAHPLLLKWQEILKFAWERICLRKSNNMITITSLHPNFPE